MRKFVALVAASCLCLAPACDPHRGSPVAPVGTSTDQPDNPMMIPAADQLNPKRSGTPGIGIEAVPPSFAGWNVVSGSRTELFGPIWDQDWRITFYLPGRTSVPTSRMIAAKNLRGTWLTYNSYALYTGASQSGYYLKVTYVFGGNRANLFGINMFDPTNWALYYQ